MRRERRKRDRWWRGRWAANDPAVARQIFYWSILEVRISLLLGCTLLSVFIEAVFAEALCGRIFKRRDGSFYKVPHIRLERWSQVYEWIDLCSPLLGSIFVCEWRPLVIRRLYRQTIIARVKNIMATAPPTPALISRM